MALVLDDLSCGPDRLRRMAAVIAQQDASLASSQAERGIARSGRDVARAEIERTRRWQLGLECLEGRSNAHGLDRLPPRCRGADRLAAAVDD